MRAPSGCLTGIVTEEQRRMARRTFLGVAAAGALAACAANPTGEAAPEPGAAAPTEGDPSPGGDVAELGVPELDVHEPGILDRGHRRARDRRSRPDDRIRSPHRAPAAAAGLPPPRSCRTGPATSDSCR